MNSPLDGFVSLHRDTFRIAIRTWSPLNGKSRFNCFAYPGWLDNAGSFDTLAPLLCEQLSITIVAIDPPGCGWSDHHALVNSYADYEEAPLVFLLANQLGWERFGLLAHSRGGAICAVSAGLYPERVQFYIILDSSLSLSGMIGADVTEIGENHAVAHMRRGVEMQQRSRAVKVFTSIEELINNSSNNESFPKSRQTATNVLMRHVQRVAGGYTFLHDRRLYASTQVLHMHEDQLTPFLLGITCPVLMIFCKDHFAPGRAMFGEAVMQHIDKRLGLIRNAQRVIVPGGHHVHSDDPVATARAIQTWWAKTMQGKEREEDMASRL